MTSRREKWKSIYTILYFDCSNNDNQFEIQQDAEIVCNLTLTGQPANYSLVAIILSDEYKVITEEGNVLSITLA
jgi:hypothetical protein